MFKIANTRLLAIIATGMLAWAPLAQAIGIGLQPSTVELAISPGQTYRQVVTVGNVHKAKTIKLNIGLADWTLDESGKLALSAPGEAERSAADWITFSPAIVTLGPETSEDIIIEMTVPYKMDYKGDHRFALLATTRLPALDERGEKSGVWNRFQLASLFYLTAMPSKSLPVITNTSIQSAADGILKMDIHNLGDAHARLQGNAIIKNADGKTLSKTPLNTVVLDKGSREYLIQLNDVEDLSSGKYTIDFDIENSYVPQNKFRSKTVKASSIEYAR